MANLKESEIALTYECENPFSSDIEIAKKLEKKKNENLDRATWGNGLDFLLSGIGYAVGIGNVWRRFSHTILYVHVSSWYANGLFGIYRWSIYIMWSVN